MDDSLFYREFLSRWLPCASVEVAGSACDGALALTMIPDLLPDVILLDMEMPKMRGSEFLQILHRQYPAIPVLVISSLTSTVFEALAAGAVDFVSKPDLRPGFDKVAFLRETITKIHIAMVAEFSRRTAAAAKSTLEPNARATQLQTRNLIAIGASTGGTEAILALVRDLPITCPGIVVVQHMPPVFTRMYAERLDKICKMTVLEAKDYDRVIPGQILIAAGGRQLRVLQDANGYYVRCQTGEKVSGHCPSVDALFESVACAAGQNAIGIILTGMGADGAKELLAMRKAGAYTIGQDQDSCVVYGMPMVAHDLGALCEQLPLSKIKDALLRQL